MGDNLEDLIFIKIFLLIILFNIIIGNFLYIEYSVKIILYVSSWG